jgi:hypothetical protein
VCSDSRADQSIVDRRIDRLLAERYRKSHDVSILVHPLGGCGSSARPRAAWVIFSGRGWRRAPDEGAPVGQRVADPLGNHLGGHEHPPVAEHTHGVVTPSAAPVVRPDEGRVTGEAVLRGGTRGGRNDRTGGAPGPVRASLETQQRSTRWACTAVRLRREAGQVPAWRSAVTAWAVAVPMARLIAASSEPGWQRVKTAAAYWRPSG